MDFAILTAKERKEDLRSDSNLKNNKTTEIRMEVRPLAFSLECTDHVGMLLLNTLARRVKSKIVCLKRLRTYF